MFNRWRILVAALLFVAVPGVALAARGYATNDVSMHAGPGVGYPVVDMIPAGAHVNIHGCLSNDSWCDVSWDSDRGWVAAAYLNYFYNDRYVYLPDYIGQIDIPVVAFSLGTYWNDYYVGRPWYHRRAYWQRYWHHHHPHFVSNPNPQYVAGARNRQVGPNRSAVTRAPTVGQNYRGRHTRPLVARHGHNAVSGGHFQVRHFTGRHTAPHFAGNGGATHFAAPQGRPQFGQGGAMHFAAPQGPPHFNGQAGHFAAHNTAPQGHAMSRGALNAHASVGMGGGHPSAGHGGGPFQRHH